MVLKLAGLVKRGDVWVYRKVVPPQLRSLIGATEIWRSLGTDDLDQAQERWREVRAEVDRSFQRGQCVPSSSQLRNSRSENRHGQAPTPHEAEQIQGDGENPPISVIFTRYYAERKLPAKTRLEWDLVLERTQMILGAEKPIRSVTQAHVRQLKDLLLSDSREARR